MIFDGFIFFNEIELLELRLETMYEHIDRFIIVESRKTFTNQNKALFFEKNRERFKKYLDKIEYVVIDEFPEDCSDAWDREYYQRNAILYGIKEANPDDILIISDLDEIISPYGIRRIKHILRSSPKKMLRLELLLSWYFLNYIDQKSFFWAAPVAYTLGNQMEKDAGKHVDPFRDEKGRILPQVARSWNDCEKVACAGWHFSYMGGIERIKEKMTAFSHQEFNTKEWLDDERIIDMIKSGKDLFDRGTEEFASIPVSFFMPSPIKNNPQRYKAWLCDFRPMSKKNYIRLRIKYICETTFLRRLYHSVKLLHK